MIPTSLPFFIFYLTLYITISIFNPIPSEFKFSLLIKKLIEILEVLLGGCVSVSAAFIGEIFSLADVSFDSLCFESVRESFPVYDSVAESCVPVSCPVHDSGLLLCEEADIC